MVEVDDRDRLARAATGRELVIKFAGCYHGHVDGLLAEAGSGLATQGIPSPGVTEAQAADTIVVPWNDPARSRRGRGSSRRGRLPPCWPSRFRPTWAWFRAAGFLELLRGRCDQAGALLVLDEVITGFRVGRGGAQERLERAARPDDAGQGARRRPAARRGRRAQGRDGAARAGGEAYQAGTLSGTRSRPPPASPRSGLLDAGRLRAARRQPPSGSPQACASAAAEPACRYRSWPSTGLLTVFFSDQPVSDYAGARACDHRGVRGLLRGDARSRHLPAAVPVRGLVPVARLIPSARRRDAARPPRRRSGGLARGVPRRVKAARGHRSALWWPPACEAAERAGGLLVRLVESILEGYLAALRRAARGRLDDPDPRLLEGD